MNILQSILSLVTSGMILLSSGLETIAPHQAVNGNLFLVNRQWMISENYVPSVVDSHVRGHVRMMRADAAQALKEMFEACRAETGKTLVSVSGYRSYGKQSNLYRRKLRRVNGSVEKAQYYVAPPGSSEHQLGLAMDIGQMDGEGLSASFGKTAAGAWARENCWRFGFILRYDDPWESITGYKYEPWHFRYVGKENAEAIHEANVPLETWLLGHRASLLLDLLEEE